MIEHAISSFEELSKIISQVHNGGRSTLYKTNIRTPMEVYQMDGMEDGISVTKGKLENGRTYYVLQITRGHKKRTTSFYVEGPDYRAYTNYWHAYAHMLRMEVS